MLTPQPPPPRPPSSGHWNVLGPLMWWSLQPFLHPLILGFWETLFAVNPVRYRIALIFRGSKFSRIAVFENFVEIISRIRSSNMPHPHFRARAGVLLRIS